MIPRLRILRTKSRSGIAIPLGTRRTVDGQTVEVLGLIKRQVKPNAVLQWWIVSLEGTNSKTPPFLRR